MYRPPIYVPNLTFHDTTVSFEKYNENSVAATQVAIDARTTT
jgi:hypothetical protein